MAWQPFAVNEFGLLDTCDFTTNLWQRIIAPNTYLIVQSDLGGEETPFLIGYGVDIPWVRGQSYNRMPLFYFARYDANDNKIGYVGFDIEIVSNYTHTMNAQVSITISACVRDLQRQIVTELGGRSIGTAAPATTHYDTFELKFFLSIGKATDDTIAVGGVGQIYCGKKDQMDGKGYLWAGVISSNLAWNDIKYSTKEKSTEYGVKSVPKGGYNVTGKHGTFDDSSDTITLSQPPTFNAGMSGYFHAYFVSETDLLNIGKAIFPEPFITSTDIIQSMNNLIVTFWNSKKIDCILDCLILPIAVPFGTKENIKCGGGYLMYYTGSHESFVEGYPVTQYYVDFTCGKISLDEYWANFLDHTGTRIKIFIPAVGYVDLQTEYLNGGEIELIYRFNIVDGSFMAYIISTSGHSKLKDSVIAQYSGVWAMHIPLTAQDNSSKVSGLISAVGAVTAGAMTGGASMGLGAVSSLGNTMIQKPTTVHANGYNASSSFLTHRKPYIIIERQSSQFSEIYPSETGLPCYVAMPLSQVSGFTVIENPVLNIDCNDEEYNEICNLLKSGVIF